LRIQRRNGKTTERDEIKRLPIRAIEIG